MKWAPQASRSGRVELVSLDAYGTILDIDSELMPSVEAFVEEEGLECPAELLGAEWAREFVKAYEAMTSGDEFLSIREITTRALRRTLGRVGVAADAARGTEIWLERLKRAAVFDDVAPAVEFLRSKGLRVIVVSDADDDVLLPALSSLPFERGDIFTSWSMRAYKLNGLFEKVLRAAGAAPGDCMHVGDMASDIRGASSAGMGAILIRRGQGPRVPVPAEFAAGRVISSLAELATVLDGRGEMK